MPNWLRLNLRILRLAMQADLRSPGLRAFAVTGAAGVGVFAAANAALAGTTAILLTTWLGRVYGMAAALWFAYAANRDLDVRSGPVLRSKPVDGARFALITWAAGLCVWLLMLGLAFAAAAAAQLPASGLSAVAANGIGFGRAALLVVSAATFSFTLSRLMRTPLGGVITIFAWFCTVAGARYVPNFLRPDYTQNAPLFLSAAGLMLCAIALGVERFRRGELRRPVVPVLAVLPFAALTAGGAMEARSSTFDPDEPSSGIWHLISTQHLESGRRVPGFWLPDGKGGIVRTADQHGKVLLIYLFAADDVDSGRSLRALDAVTREYGGRGVQPIGVCLSRDKADGWALSLAGGHRFPIGSDRATLQMTGSAPISSVAQAFDATLLPMLVVTDRRRRVRAMTNDPLLDLPKLRAVIEERLAEEPR